MSCEDAACGKHERVCRCSWSTGSHFEHHTSVAPRQRPRNRELHTCFIHRADCVAVHGGSHFKPPLPHHALPLQARRPTRPRYANQATRACNSHLSERHGRVELGGRGTTSFDGGQMVAAGRFTAGCAGLRRSPLQNAESAGVAARLCWRWRHLPEGCVPSGCSLVPAARGYAGGRPRSAEAEPIPDLHAAAVSLRADIRSATVRFTIEAGDWLPLVIFDDVSAHATSQRFGDRTYGFILAEPLEVGGDVVITIAHDVSGMPLRVVAVDSDGQLRVAKMSGGGVNGRVFSDNCAVPRSETPADRVAAI